MVADGTEDLEGLANMSKGCKKTARPTDCLRAGSRGMLIKVGLKPGSQNIEGRRGNGSGQASAPGAAAALGRELRDGLYKQMGHNLRASNEMRPGFHRDVFRGSLFWPKHGWFLCKRNAFHGPTTKSLKRE